MSLTLLLLVAVDTEKTQVSDVVTGADVGVDTVTVEKKTTSVHSGGCPSGLGRDLFRLSTGTDTRDSGRVGVLSRRLRLTRPQTFYERWGV